MIGRRHHLGVAVVDFELRRRHFRVILFVLESHGPLHFGAPVDKGAQRIAGQRVIVSAGVHILEFAGFVIAPLGVEARENEAFDFIGGVQRVAVLFELSLGISLQHAAHVADVRAAVLLQDFAEHHYLALAENVRRAPVERGPIDAQA